MNFLKRVQATLALIFIFSGLFPAISEGASPSDEYALVWSDEFDGSELDESKWGYRGLGPRRDAINVKESVSVDEGNLVLTTRKVGDEYHTAMIGTHDRFELQFGYFECRVKFQDEIGHWSAFWLQSPTIQVGDPKITGTEIDIFEYLVRYEDTIHINLHWNGYGPYHKTAGSKYKFPKIKDGFHTIGIEWKPDEYIFYVDGEVAWRTNWAVSHRTQYIILSLEVGKWAGDIREAELPDSVYFDYVRVYQKG